MVASSRMYFSLSARTIARLEDTGNPSWAKVIDGWKRRDQETFPEPYRLKTVQKPWSSDGVAIDLYPITDSFGLSTNMVSVAAAGAVSRALIVWHIPVDLNRDKCVGAEGKEQLTHCKESWRNHHQYQKTAGSQFRCTGAKRSWRRLRFLPLSEHLFRFPNRARDQKWLQPFCSEQTDFRMASASQTALFHSRPVGWLSGMCELVETGRYRRS